MSEILDLIFQHFDDLKALDFLLIGVFTALAALAIFRTFRWIYKEALAAKQEAIETYERLVGAYRQESEQLRSQNERLASAKNELERSLLEVTAAADSAQRELQVLWANFAYVSYVASRLNLLVLAHQMHGVAFAMWEIYERRREAGKHPQGPDPQEARAQLQHAFERLFEVQSELGAQVPRANGRAFFTEQPMDRLIPEHEPAIEIQAEIDSVFQAVSKALVVKT